MKNKTNKIPFKIDVAVYPGKDDVLLMREHVGEASLNDDEYDLSLLGWNRMGLIVENKKTKNKIRIRF